MLVSFVIKLPSDLRKNIKREARKRGISMNEFIVTVLDQFVAYQQEQKNGKDEHES